MKPLPRIEYVENKDGGHYSQLWRWKAYIQRPDGEKIRIACGDMWGPVRVAAQYQRFKLLRSLRRG